MNVNQTYVVYACKNGSETAETNLTAHDVVRHIYRYDGADYRLDPKILTHLYDDQNKKLPDTQDTTESGDLIFEVCFRDNEYLPFYKSNRIAIGKNEYEAEESFLQESFDGTLWNKSLWAILTKEQFQEEQEENSDQFIKRLSILTTGKNKNQPLRR